MSFAIRQKLVDIARRHIGKTEVSKNAAPWIAPLWKSTTYPRGMRDRAPYCAAAVAWAVHQWGQDPEVLKVLKMIPEQFEQWRCKSAAAFQWGTWGRERKLRILSRNDNFHTGDIVIYSKSHIEIYTGDSGDRIVAVGYNTNSAGSRDGDGCWEKSRARSTIKEVVRILD